MNAITQPVAAVTRRVIGENMEYERYYNGSRRFVYHWGHNQFVASIEVIPVGRHRYAIIRNGKADVPVFVEGGRDLLSALSDFRHRAAIALDDLRVWQREAV